jgi:hypothetical protein
LDCGRGQSQVTGSCLRPPSATQQRWSAAVSERVPREDVARARNSNLESGFKARLDTSALPLAEYQVLMLFWQDRSSQMCDNGRRVLLQ